MKIVSHPVIRIIITLVSLAICIGLVRSIFDTLNRRNVVSERREVLKKEQDLHAQLQEQLKEATSPAFIEKQARDKLGLAKEGEIIVLLGKPGNTEASRSSDGISGPTLSQWKKWWSLFF
jgi:cell division protein FtsB